MNNFDTNIPEADLDPIKDTDGKDDFTEGETYEQKLEIIKGKYDSLEELIQAHKDVSFWDKLKLTVQGKTDVGRVTGTVLNIAELFAPSWAVKARDVIQSQTKPRPMLNSKKWYQSKTIWSAVLVAVMAVLNGLGVDIASNPQLTSTILQVGMAVAGAFGLYGLRDAIDKQQDKLGK